MVKKGQFDFEGEEWEDVSADAKDLIQKLICKPERRLSAGEALQHSWIRNQAKSAKFEKLAKINIDALKKFQYHQKLKQAALTAIAVHINPKDIKYLKDVFKALDKNGDGSLQLEELRQGLSDIKNGEEILQLMQAADTDKSGTINYTGMYLMILYLYRIHRCHSRRSDFLERGKLEKCIYDVRL